MSWLMTADGGSLDAGLVRDAAGDARVDADALVATLFDQEARSLVRLARVFCDDVNAAEDLVQEAFLRLHRTAHTIRDPARAAPYLRSIVINLARDHNRRGLMSFRHRDAMRQPESTPGFEDDAAAAHDDQVVLEALRLLPDRQRSCLVLRFYLQLSEREIADTLDISPNSVKTHCRRGLASLEATLAERAARWAHPDDDPTGTEEVS
jgi:RNA polymerase sigma-70 factor (sigma-E family)